MRASAVVNCQSTPFVSGSPQVTGELEARIIALACAARRRQDTQPGPCDYWPTPVWNYSISIPCLI
jgi:hypothetical protein